jgi:hypothetical protein
MTVFSDAARWLQDNRLAHATIPVVYERDGTPHDLVAWLGRTQFEEVDNEGLVIRNEMRDYFIQISDYESAGLDFPIVGDLIRETQGSETFIHIVTRPPGMQHYDRDTHRLRYRIHTKRISAE